MIGFDMFYKVVTHTTVYHSCSPRNGVGQLMLLSIVVAVWRAMVQHNSPVGVHVYRLCETIVVMSIHLEGINVVHKAKHIECFQ